MCPVQDHRLGRGPPRNISSASGEDRSDLVAAIFRTWRHLKTELALLSCIRGLVRTDCLTAGDWRGGNRPLEEWAVKVQMSARRRGDKHAVDSRRPS
jgi:hypothetical protein